MAITNGWADAYGVTGGEAGQTVRVTNDTDFLSYAKSTSPYIIEVSGTITLPAGMHSLQSNKTITGVGKTGKITGGGLYFLNKVNIIIKNLTINNVDDDAIGFDNSRGFWVTNCDLSSAGDGLLDVIRGSDYGTISWNRFSNHSLTILIGHDDAQTTDRGKLRVTLHHNYFDNVQERQPRVRFGQVHTFNNYHRGISGVGYPNNLQYAIGVGDEAKISSENNYFENLDATYYLDDVNAVGYVKDAGSFFTGTGTRVFRPLGVTWSPISFYTYNLDKASDVKDIVLANAGLVKDVVVAPPTTPTDPTLQIIPAFVLGLDYFYTDHDGLPKPLAGIGDSNPLPGKKLLNFGDSIAYGSGNANVGYAHLIATRNSMTLTNRSNGGATVGSTASNNIIDQINSAIGQAADYILFNGLTNDIANSGNVPLGVISTGHTASLDVSTFCGGFENICKVLKTNWLGAKIIYVRPHSMPITSRDLQKQIDYGNKAIEICKKWSIPYVDMYSEGGLNTNISIMRTTYTTDGTHPNAGGYQLYYAPIIEAKMKTL